MTDDERAELARLRMVHNAPAVLERGEYGDEEPVPAPVPSDDTPPSVDELRRRAQAAAAEAPPSIEELRQRAKVKLGKPAPAFSGDKGTGELAAEYLEEMAPAQQGEAALRGLGQGVTGRYLDEVSAWIESKVPGLGLEPYELIARMQSGERMPQARPYETIRDENRAKDRAAVKAYPTTFMGTEMGGDLLAMSKLPASLVSRLLHGTVSGVGASESEDLKHMLGEGVATAAAGEALAPAGKLVGRGIVGAARKVSPDWTRIAEESAVKAAGAIQHNMQRLGTAATRKLGREMLDDDLIPFGGSKTAILERAQAARGKAGGEMGETLKFVDSIVPEGFDWPRARLRLLERAEKLNPVQEDLVRQAVTRMDDQFGRAHSRKLGFKVANEMKSDLGDTLNWVTDPKVKMKLQRQLYGLFNEEIEQQLGEAFAREAVPAMRGAGARAATGPSDFVDLRKQKALPSTSTDELAQRTSMTGPGTGAPRVDEPFDEAGAARWRADREKAKAEAIAQFKDQKRRFGTAVDTEKLAEKGQAREVGNNAVSLTDYLTAIGGITGMGTAGGAYMGDAKAGAAAGAGGASLIGTAILGKKMLRQRGRAMVARSSDVIARKTAPWFAKNIPAALGKFGPLLAREYQRGGDDALNATVAALADDEDFQEAIALATSQQLEEEQATP
jgi:hypothetical protein